LSSRSGDGLIYLSAASAVDGSGAMVGGKDVAAQTAAAIDRIAANLAAAGSSLDRVVSTTVYLKSGADFQRMNEAYRSYWSGDPPARTTVAAALAHPDSLVEIAATGVLPGISRAAVHPEGWVRSPNPYSYAIRTDDMLFLSGIVPRRGRDNTVVSGDIAVQTRAVLDNVADILQAVGLSLKNVVSNRVYITDVAHFAAMNEVYRECFATEPPARATLQCGLMNSQYLVEMTMTASMSPRAVAVASDGTMPISPAIRSGRRVHLSGMLGNTPQTRGDVAAQTRETLKRIGATLAKAAATPADVVDAIVYLRDVNDAPAIEAEYRRFFGGFDLPACTAVGAGLVPTDGLVEIMMTAVTR
jgi:2-iminobutanoate/2-iminopropanoate deaminase